MSPEPSSTFGEEYRWEYLLKIAWILTINVMVEIYTKNYLMYYLLLELSEAWNMIYFTIWIKSSTFQIWVFGRNRFSKITFCLNSSLQYADEGAVGMNFWLSLHKIRTQMLNSKAQSVPLQGMLSLLWLYEISILISLQC